MTAPRPVTAPPPLEVQLRVAGHVSGDLLRLLGDLDARWVPRHTVITMPADPATLGHLLQELGTAGSELDRATVWS